MKQVAYIEPNFNEWVNSFSFKCEIKVRFSETDMFGHMNNTVPFTYFEEARIEFFKSIGLMQEWMSSNNQGIPVVADLQCDFLRQVFFGETLHIHVKIHHLGRSSIDLHYYASNEKNEPCFVGRGTMVQVSKVTGKSVPWTKEISEILEKNKIS
ncbi:thioesterase family protein [Bacillus sp. FJAT-47783]|uniref:acyl-CoA thioesterase n=1 Tax=Bacillus sp. FJAT-47783 TaxID=2922712 RepID=UPI001FACA2F7|nr:thioesterase family protein [Bacillus sp. FJAT-47783]